MTKTTFKEKSMKRGLWSQKNYPTDNIRPKEDPTTLTTHPTTSHNIKLTKMEDVHDYLKNSCVYTWLLAKKLHVYAVFCQKPTCICDFWPKIRVCTWLLAKNLSVYVDFGQKPACIHDFWPKSCMYTQILAKNLRVYVTFGQNFAYVCDFWPKTHVYKEGSGKK